MRTFKDDKGQAWDLAVTVGGIRRIKAALPDVDLLKIDEPDPACTRPTDAPKEWEAPALQIRLSLDSILVCEIIALLLKPQIEAQGRTAEDFFENMAGRGLREGLAAFWGDLDDFFQSLGRSDLASLASAHCKLLAEIVQGNKSAIEAWEAQQEEKNNASRQRSTAGSLSSDSQ